MVFELELPSAVASPHSGDTVLVSRMPRSLLVQGKTFEQWREQLLTELDPMVRARRFGRSRSSEQMEAERRQQK